MSTIAETTFSVLLLILIGALLKTKIKTSSHRDGLKFVILSVALPATIFIALMSVNIDLDIIYLPIFAILLNCFLFVFTYFSSIIIAIDKNSASMRSLLMIIPSYAPGLSLFPFLALYLGKESIAQASLADLGNKIFVLYALYFIAFRFYTKIYNKKPKFYGKTKYLTMQFFKEPINLSIFVALAILLSGGTIETLPSFIGGIIEELSNITAPLILLFIGMSLSIARERLIFLISVLSLRAAAGLFFSGLALMVFPISSPAVALLLVLFPQSACSFWPCAHIASINLLEQKSKNNNEKTFDSGLVFATLALSFPFSTITILVICTMGDSFIDPIKLMLVASAVCCLSIFLIVRVRIKSRRVVRSVAFAWPERTGAIWEMKRALGLKLKPSEQRPQLIPVVLKVAAAARTKANFK